jgi:hypothetical protein
VLKGLAIGGALAASGTRLASARSHAGLNAQTASATLSLYETARAYLETLAGNRSKALVAYSDALRTDWHWFPPANYTRREGVPLLNMNAPQREAALALLRSATTQIGFDKALAIMSLQKDLGRDDGAYFFSVYGEPSKTSVWGFGVEGHHLSLNYTVTGERIIGAPLFLGASPTRVLSGPRKGLQAMKVEEESARTLMRSLSDSLRRDAIFAQRTPGDTISRNAVTVKAPAPAGIRGAQMNAEQRTLALTLVEAYTALMPDAIASAQRKSAAAEIETLRFAWAGSLNPGERYYYRLQGAGWMIDHDNSRDSGKHIHSQWREFATDFGGGTAR